MYNKASTASRNGSLEIDAMLQNKIHDIYKYFNHELIRFFVRYLNFATLFIRLLYLQPKIMQKMGSADNRLYKNYVKMNMLKINCFMMQSVS